MAGRHALTLVQPRWSEAANADIGIRHLLRQVALELFAEHGFHGISLRQLAAAMHMHAGSLYNHIDSKQALLFELIEEHESDLLELLHTEVPLHADGLLQLETYVRMHLQFNSLHGQRHALARLEFRGLNCEQQESIERLRLVQVQQLEKILQRCALPTAECGPIAQAMVAMLDGVMAGYPNGGRPPLEHLAALFSRMVLTGLSPT